MARRKKTSIFIGILAAIGIATIGFVGIGSAAGWLEFHEDSNGILIQFNKDELGKDAQEAVESTENALESSAKALDNVEEEMEKNNPKSEPDTEAEEKELNILDDEESEQK